MKLFFYKTKIVQPKHPDPDVLHHSLIKGNRLHEEMSDSKTKAGNLQDLSGISESARQ